MISYIATKPYCNECYSIRKWYMRSERMAEKERLKKNGN